MSKKNHKRQTRIFISIITAIVLCGFFFWLGFLIKSSSESNGTTDIYDIDDLKDEYGYIMNTETYSGLSLPAGYYKATNQDNTVSVLIIFKNSNHFKYYPHIKSYDDGDLENESDNDEGSYWWYGKHWSVDGAGASVEEEAQKQINRINAVWHPGNGSFNGYRDSFWFDVQENNTVIQTSRTTGEVTKYTLIKEF